MCRLYPLGRHLRRDGVEYFSVSDGHPQSAGEYNRRGTITEYLESQETRPFIDAGDQYFHWFCSAYDKLGASDDLVISEAIAGADDHGLLDMDAMIAHYLAATGGPEPENLEDRLQLHLKILHDVVEKLEIRDAQESSTAVRELTTT